ncbi:hypothetical protein C0991_009239 [Blastosporella zonata]|nr:hypothetical protein C0991_009239 [Blastosporella zonata]
MANSTRGGHFSPPPQLLPSDSPSAKIWSVYVAEADSQDRALALQWKGDMDALLIFAGLFSASITAFLIESYKTLTPDPTVVLLNQISLQLTAIANGTQPTLLANPVPSHPSYASLLCNAFWFLSLAFSITSALAATLVDQWARNYLTTSQKHPAPQTRARIRAYLYQGLQRFGMSTVVETIPTLLHISLFLFFAGLIEFLSPINPTICNLSVGILVICTALYAIVTILPILHHHCPYQTPFTSLVWQTWQAIRYSTYFCLESHQPLTLSVARENSATMESPARDARDEEALSRTLESLSDGAELAAFIDGIPGFLADGSANSGIMRRLLLNKNINLGPHIVERLHLSPYRDPSEAVTGAISCLAAIWNIFACCWHDEILENDVEEWFDDETLPILETFAYEGPVIGHFLWSTTALVTSSLLDSYLYRAKSMEQELRRLGIELPWIPAPEPCADQLRVQRYLLHDSPDVSSGCIMAFKTWLSLLRRDFTTIKAELSNQLSDPPPTDKLLQSLWSFQALLNEAQITVYNDFLTKSLSDFPPYEPLNTFYHLVFDHDLALPVSSYNQSRLVDFLSRHEDIPLLAMDQLLHSAAILHDQALISEAKDIIGDYLTLHPNSNSASKALMLLAGQISESRPSVLHIF